jgi:hypothetical protein
MKPVQGSRDLVLPDVTEFARPVLRVFDEIADRQPDVAFDRGEDPHDPASTADLHAQPFLTEYAVVDRIVRHLESAFVAEKLEDADIAQPARKPAG